jgi:hypothetical protein
VAQQNHVFQKRALVKIDGLFDKNKLNGSVVSVSVKHKEPILFTHDENNNTAQTASSNNEIYLPDYKGIIVSGKIYNKGNQIADGQEVLLSLPGEGADLLSSISDENGKFNFLLESQNGNCDMIFILPDSNMNIKLEDPFLSSINYSNNQTLCIDSVSMNYLKERYYYTQLAHNFDNPAYEPEPADTLKKQAFTFYSTPNRNYLTNDYIQLDSVAEYFRELIPSVHFNLEKNKYDLHIIGQTSKMELGNKPGVFVDGVFYTNFDNLAKIPANKLDRIEVLWDKYYYKDFTFDGIVSIHTKTSDFYSVDLQENMTRIIYPLTNRNSIRFKPKSYSEISTLSKVPDLRYLLYWNPSVDVTKINDLVFYTSDVAGTYEITISGYSFSGEWNTITTEFYVQ